MTFSPFVVTSPPHPRDLHSSPTRRSSDLGIQDLIEVRGPGCLAALVRAHAAPTVDQHRDALVARVLELADDGFAQALRDRKSTRLNSSHPSSSYAVFCLKKKKMVRRGSRA